MGIPLGYGTITLDYEEAFLDPRLTLQPLSTLGNDPQLINCAE